MPAPGCRLQRRLAATLVLMATASALAQDPAWEWYQDVAAWQEQFAEVYLDVTLQLSEARIPNPGPENIDPATIDRMIAVSQEAHALAMAGFELRSTLPDLESGRTTFARMRMIEAGRESLFAASGLLLRLWNAPVPPPERVSLEANLKQSFEIRDLWLELYMLPD